MILKIKNTKVDFFNNFSLSLKFDGIASTFAFDYYLNPENDLHKELAHVGHYHKCSVEHNGETILTGRLLSKSFKSSNKPNLVGIGGYSLSGVLGDCSIPVEDYPLQSDGLTLREIASKFTSRFGIPISVSGSVSGKMDEKIKTTTASAGESVASYLSGLASQRNIVVTNTVNGGILFTKALTNKAPLFNFEPGMPGVSYDLSFNGQSMHSHITVMKQADADGGNAGESTVRNPYVPFTFRPIVKIQSSGTDIDTELAAKTARASELKNLKLKIKLDRWEDPSGGLIRENNTITVINPELFIFKRSKFFIEEVKFASNEKGRTATLTCVIPSVYDGSEPVYIFEETE